MTSKTEEELQQRCKALEEENAALRQQLATYRSVSNVALGEFRELQDVVQRTLQRAERQVPYSFYEQIDVEIKRLSVMFGRLYSDHDKRDDDQVGSTPPTQHE